MCTISMFNMRPTDDNDTNPLMSSRFWGGDGKQSDMRNLWILFRTMNELIIPRIYMMSCFNDHMPVLRRYKELFLQQSIMYETI